jgi:5'-nucleotidase/UDP-sugar diphosphatase
MTVMRKILFPIAALLLALLACTAVLRDPVRTVTLFYTSDEHGYIEPERDGTRSYGGAAMLMTGLRRAGYDPGSDASLLLSGGDMWSGAAISSWFQGVPALQVAGAMGYNAAAIGNHEFDLGMDKFLENEKIADFPFLAANIIETGSGKQPQFVHPYILKDINGVKTAVIGLAGVFTPSIVVPSNIKGLEFTGYEKALRESVHAARSEGAELAVVIAHVCPNELRKLAPVAAELSIPLLAGGHCHTLENFVQDGVRIIGAGNHMRDFARVDITLDAGTGKVLNTKADLTPVENSLNGNPLRPDAAISAIVSEWSAKIEKELGGTIGYSENGVAIGWPLYNLLVDSWLWAYPQADIAISNFGGYRQGIPAGTIKRSDIVSIWPFPNELVEVDLTGRQIMDNLECCGGAVSGITYKKSGGGVVVNLKNGRPLDPGATYRVLVNSYIYEEGDKYLFSKQNPAGRYIGINFRDPAIDWILSKKTAPGRPLEMLLDAFPRAPDRR